MEQEGLTLEQQVSYLKIELTKAKTEATKLRKTLKENSRYAKIVDRAYEDALLMGFWRSMGIRPTRRFSALYSITQSRWEHALALLRMARLINGKSRWAASDMTTMERKLSQARDKALEDAQLFFLRHTRHR
jgi:hypothetical protein